MSDRIQKKARIKRATASAQRDATKLDGVALQQLKELYKNTLKEVRGELKQAADDQNIIRLERLGRLKDRLDNSLSRLEQTRFQLLKQMMEQAGELGIGPWEQSVGIVAASGALDRALLTVRTFTAKDGLQLSDRLWRLKDNDYDMVVRSVQRAVVRGYDASKAAAEFLEQGLPVPGHIIKAQGSAHAESLGKVIGRDLMTGEGNPYEQARRLFRTEINRAHGTAYREAAFEDEDVVGTRFKLSPNHRKRDICDMHASVNRYGLGRGVYPKGKSPWPAHPNTISYEEAVFADEVEQEDKQGKQDRISWLQGQDYETQRSVLRSNNKVTALNAGVLKENQIATPWRDLKPRFEKQGIDVSKLKPLPKANSKPPVKNYTPAGAPVSNAFSAKGYRGVSQRTLSAIDRVHGDGRLPEIPIKRSSATKYNGVYQYYRSGDPIDIKVSAHGDHKEFTLAHEIGHFLDHQGLGNIGSFASTSDRALEKWRTAVAKTDAIQQLIKLIDGPAQVGGYAVQKRYVHYLLMTEEIWARSYAQYIATRSGEKVLLEQLKAAQNRKQRAIIHYPDQWDDKDFEPVAAAIDELFEELGWLRGR